jgi:hypothetical protein
MRERLDLETSRMKEGENQMQLLTCIRRFFAIKAQSPSETATKTELGWRDRKGTWRPIISGINDEDSPFDPALKNDCNNADEPAGSPG